VIATKAISMIYHSQDSAFVTPGGMCQERSECYRYYLHYLHLCGTGTRTLVQFLVE